jgi:glyoxylase-like metal-dependent hydrolase (beta-lactamase superfamily II)
MDRPFARRRIRPARAGRAGGRSGLAIRGEAVGAPPVLADGDEIDLGGGVSAVAVAAPGHTPGSVAFHLPGPRVLFTGDTVARHGEPLTEEASAALRAAAANVG